MYEYPCRLIRVIDGNTIEADIEIWFGQTLRQRIKLFGIDNTKESMEALVKEIPREFVCKVIYSKRGRNGRCLGHVFKEDANGELINVNEMLIEQGLAKKYDS